MTYSTERYEAAKAKLRFPHVGSGRDDAVREAAAAGMSIDRIQGITGLAKTTIMRILNTSRKQPR